MNTQPRLSGSDDLRVISDEGFQTSLFIPDPSLEGKTGAAVFFALLAQKTNNQISAHFAETLLEMVCDSLTLHLPVGFSYGICGIGWSIEFLKSKGFLDVDTDDVLGEIDHSIMEKDVRRIGDLSLKSGLKGIAAYVAARLESNRNLNAPFPFDDGYLSELKERLTLEGMDSTLGSYSIDSIWSEYLESLDAEDSNLPFWQRGLLMLEGDKTVSFCSGESGDNHSNQSPVSQEETKDLVIIFSGDCLGLQYGMGTYIKTLIDAIDRNTFQVMTVNLASNKFSLIEQEDIIQIDIPSINVNTERMETSESYALSCFHLIAAHMPKANNVICHFNCYGYVPLIKLFRENFSAFAVLTVHYTNCGMEMKGDFLQMKHLLSRQTGVYAEDEKEMLEIFQIEKSTMEICDIVIAPSPHTIEYLTDLYGITPEKLQMIPHTLRHLPKISEDRSCLRRKFGIPEKDKVILYVGRVSKDKGVYDLIESIKTLMEEDPDIRLLIVGTGELQKAYRTVYPNYIRINFTGFLQSEDLSSMYRLADIGVVTSHYEEFGYVALEMAAAGLPSVVSDAGGLPATTKDFDDIYMYKSDDIDSLTQTLNRALSDIDKLGAKKRIPLDMSEASKKFRDAINNIYQFKVTSKNIDQEI